MIVEILSAISITYGVIKHFNDDFFYEVETDKRQYAECSWEYVGKQLANPNALQLFAKKDEDGKTYIYWKHTCKD